MRLEDIDINRCRPNFVADLHQDLAWLGLRWPTPVRQQSHHFAFYQKALEDLKRMGVLYPCFCTRKDLERELTDMFGAPHYAPSGPDGPLYPGTCRTLTDDQRSQQLATGKAHAWRLNMDKALFLASRSGQDLSWIDERAGLQPLAAELMGDIVLGRKDIPTSYHLAVTLDDHLQGITLVTRGRDLFPASHIHRLLQILFGLDHPRWCHHDLVKDAQGQRMAKRRQSLSLKAMREAGQTAEEVMAKLDLSKAF